MSMSGVSFLGHMAPAARLLVAATCCCAATAVLTAAAAPAAGGGGSSFESLAGVGYQKRAALAEEDLSLVDRLVADAGDLTELRAPTMGGSMRNLDIRRNYQVELDFTNATHRPLFTKVMALVSSAAREAPGLAKLLPDASKVCSGGCDLLVNVYASSELGYYDWHHDAFRLDQTARSLSFVAQLSDGDSYEGGGLQFASPSNEELFVDRSLGTAVVFPSFSYHFVHPTTKGQRRTLVGWCHMDLPPNYKHAAVKVLSALAEGNMSQVRDPSTYAAKHPGRLKEKEKAKAARSASSSGELAAGFGDASWALGSIYGGTMGMPFSPAKIVHWYLLSAAQGSSYGEHAVAQLYSSEDRQIRTARAKAQMRKDSKKALHWYQRAASHGSAVARKELVDFLTRPAQGKPPSGLALGKARHWAVELAKPPVEDAEANLFLAHLALGPPPPAQAGSALSLWTEAVRSGAEAELAASAACGLRLHWFQQASAKQRSERQDRLRRAALPPNDSHKAALLLAEVALLPTLTLGSLPGQLCGDWRLEEPKGSSKSKGKGSEAGGKKWAAALGKAVRWLEKASETPAAPVLPAQKAVVENMRVTADDTEVAASERAKRMRSLLQTQLQALAHDSSRLSPALAQTLEDVLPGLGLGVVSLGAGSPAATVEL